MTIEPGDVTTNQLKPGWVPDGWERGDPVEMFKGVNDFYFYRIIQTPDAFQGKMRADEHAYTFQNWRIPEYLEWLDWWLYE